MISAAPSSPSGSVLSLSSYTPSTFPSDSVILCRLTAPVVTFAFQLIRRGVGCRVLGKEIGTGLITLIKKLSAISLDDLARRLEMYESREREKFLRKNDEQSASAVGDKCQCIRIFIDAQPPDGTIASLCFRVASLFDDSALGLLTLSTIHKAKGLEWPTVFLLDRFRLMPSKFARTPWAFAQEQNLIYVALTRAQLHLRYIDSGCWQREEKLSCEQKAMIED